MVHASRSCEESDEDVIYRHSFLEEGLNPKIDEALAAQNSAQDALESLLEQEAESSSLISRAQTRSHSAQLTFNIYCRFAIRNEVPMVDFHLTNCSRMMRHMEGKQSTSTSLVCFMSSDDDSTFDKTKKN